MTLFLTLGILVLALICFIGEWIPADITALIVAIVLMVLGLVTPEEGISGFGNTATITVMAMFVLSAGIARTGAIQGVSELLLMWGGKKTSRQILVLGTLVGPIHCFVNNTAVVAVFLPIIEDWCRKRKISVSKLLMPLSYLTVLAGMITVIGASTNLLASSLSKQLGYGEFHLFQFTALGLSTFVIGMIYLALATPLLLPARKEVTSDAIKQDYGLKGYVSEVVLPPGSNLIGQTLRSSRIQRRFDVDVLELIRDGSHFSQPLMDKTLQAGDILLVRGSREDLLKIRDDRGIDILPDVKFGQPSLKSEKNDAEERVAEVLILTGSNLIGSTLKDLRFRQRYNATVLAIRRGEELVRERLGKVPLRFGDLLLLQGPKESFLGLQMSRDLLVTEQRDVENLRRDKAWIAIAIILGVVLIAALNWLPILVSALVGVALMVLTGCLKPGELYGAVRWDVIFLLAGLIPLGIAMDKSGGTQLLANQLISLGHSLSGYWLLTFFYLITSLLTAALSHNTSLVLMLPIAVDVAKTLSLNPFAFMYAVTFAASNSYLTPIGYQTHMMVYGPGGYKFLDFTRLGLPLHLLLTFVTPLLIMLLYHL